MRSMTEFDSCPCSSSTNVSMERAQSRAIACQCAPATSLMLTVIRYREDPITWAVTSPGPMLRSITEPFLRYVRPRGRRFE